MVLRFVSFWILFGCLRLPPSRLGHSSKLDSSQLVVGSNCKLYQSRSPLRSFSNFQFVLENNLKI